jgi:hypothetical protein
MLYTGLSSSGGLSSEDIIWKLLLCCCIGLLVYYEQLTKRLDDFVFVNSRCSAFVSRKKYSLWIGNSPFLDC